MCRFLLTHTPVLHYDQWCILIHYKWQSCLRTCKYYTKRATCMKCRLWYDRFIPEQIRLANSALHIKQNQKTPLLCLCFITHKLSSKPWSNQLKPGSYFLRMRMRSEFWRGSHVFAATISLLLRNWLYQTKHHKYSMYCLWMVLSEAMFY